MFLVAANTRQAIVGQKEWITTGSSGIQVQFLFSSDWDGLAKFAVFRNAEIEESAIPIALPASGLTELPAENCAAEYVDEKVYVGVYGTDGLGHIIIPTIWVSLGVLKEGAAYEGMDPPQPTQDMWAQILAIAQNAGAENAAAAEQSAEEAAEAAEAIQDMNVEAETLPDESPLTVTKEVDPETGAVTLIFGLTRGPKGTQGDDGYSPAITITPIQGGHRFTVTDKDHPTGQSFDVMNGAPGAPGSPGQDGYSPAITITTITGGHRFTVTDEDHPTGQSFDVMDGTKGDAGYSPAVTITTITGGHCVTITDEDHPTGQSFDVLDGASDAGQVSYDPTRTYQSGTVGKELSEQSNAISQKAPLIINSASGNVASFADGADGMQIRKIVGTIVPQQSGTGDPSPDNVRPISGWTGANVKGTGKNLLGGDALGAALKTFSGASYGEDSNGRYVKQWGFDNHPYQYVFDGIKENTQYTLLFKMVSEGSSALWRYVVVYTDGTEDLAFNPTDTLGTYMFVSKANKTLHSIYNRKITTDNCRVYYDESGLFEGVLDAAAFESYYGQTLPINWQTEAGTIYGGSFTLNEDGSCDIVPTHGETDLGDLTWTILTGDSGTFFQSNNLPMPAAINGVAYNMFCENYKTIPSSAYHGIGGINNSILGRSTFRAVCVVDNRFTTGADFKAAVSGVKLVYPLDTPGNPIHIPNVGSLFTYLGTNNVWIDTGSITECDYPADTKLYVDGLTVPDEDMIANANIASGKYFVVNNQLYLSTAAIAAGASIVPGTNCTATNLAEALNALNT